jgi:hypothetical protein
MTGRDEKHEMTWDGPFGKTYSERCSCGWSAMTFADTRETSIGKAHDAHLASLDGDVSAEEMRQ